MCQQAGVPKGVEEPWVTSVACPCHAGIMSLSGDSHSLPWNTEPCCASVTHPVHFLPGSFCFIDLPVEMKSFLNPLTPAIQAFNAVPSCKNVQPDLGAPWHGGFAEDHPQDTLKTHTQTKKNRAWSFCSSRLPAALWLGSVTCKASPMQGWAPAVSCRESFARGRGAKNLPSFETLALGVLQCKSYCKFSICLSASSEKLYRIGPSV